MKADLWKMPLVVMFELLGCQKGDSCFSQNSATTTTVQQYTLTGAPLFSPCTPTQAQHPWKGSCSAWLRWQPGSCIREGVGYKHTMMLTHIKTSLGTVFVFISLLFEVNTFITYFHCVQEADFFFFFTLISSDCFHSYLQRYSFRLVWRLHSQTDIHQSNTYIMHSLIAGMCTTNICGIYLLPLASVFCIRSWVNCYSFFYYNKDNVMYKNYPLLYCYSMFCIGIKYYIPSVYVQV